MDYMAENAIGCGRYHRVGMEVWALTEIIHEARTRHNKGKTPDHQNRSTAQNPNGNDMVCRTGVFGEVLLMSRLESACAPSDEQRHLQRGMIHMDIRDSEHKGTSDMIVSQRPVDIKTTRLPPPPFRADTSPRRYMSRVNRRKHLALCRDGLFGYIFVITSLYSPVCFISHIVRPSEITETWAYSRHLSDPDDKRGNNFYETSISNLSRLPVRHLYNSIVKSPFDQDKTYSRKAVQHLAFNHAEFNATMRAKYKDINWSLV